MNVAKTKIMHIQQRNINTTTVKNNNKAMERTNSFT